MTIVMGGGVDGWYAALPRVPWIVVDNSVGDSVATSLRGATTVLEPLLNRCVQQAC